MASLEQLVLDVEEVKRLLGLTNRQRIKDVLSCEQRRLETQISKIKTQEQSNSSKEGAADAAVTTPSATPVIRPPQLAAKDIKSYGWDQSEKFVKIYVTLKDVHTIPANVTVTYEENSFALRVQSLKNCNHQFARKNLLSQIIPGDSHHKVKTDSIVVFLKKKEKNQWAYLTLTEQKSKEKEKPGAKSAKPDDAGDPGDSLMKMMKNMYDEGDDDMKRTIAKAWTDSQDKKAGGDMGGGGGMGGMGGMGGLGGMMGGLGGGMGGGMGGLGAALGGAMGGGLGGGMGGGLGGGMGGGLGGGMGGGL